MLFPSAERQVSAAAENGGDAGADAVRSRLQRFIRRLHYGLRPFG